MIASASMKTQNIKRIKTAQCAAYGSAGLADTFLTFGITTLVMPIYNIGMGIDAKLIGWALVFPRILDAITDPLMGNLSDNTRSRFGRRRQYVLMGILLCALLFPFVWMPPTTTETVTVGYLIGIMCLFSIAYTIFNVPYTALGYEITQDYDERTRLFAWRMYFATAAGVTIQWLYKFCLMTGETEVEGVRVVSWLIAGLVLLFGVIPAFGTKEKSIVEKQEKVHLFTAMKSALKNRPFILLIISYVILVTALFSTGAIGLYINIFYVFDGDKDSAATVAGNVGTILIGSGFVGMLVIKKLSELTSKKTAMLISMSAALFAVLLSWFTLTPKMPYLQIVHTIIMGMGVQGGWLLFSALLGDICDEDERQTGLRQEGIYSAVMGFCNKCAGAFVGVGAAYMLEFSGYVAGMDPDPEVGDKMKIIFVAMQAVGLLVAIALMACFPITRQRAEETRRILDARKQNHADNG